MKNIGVNRFKNNRGLGVLPLVLGLSAASVATVTLISQMSLSSFQRSILAYNEWETNLGNQKALSLGGYFVAHNLVLCREDGWANQTSEKIKCIWGGDMHSPKIEKSKFQILKTSHDTDGSLVLEIANKNADEKTYITKLSLHLVDWSEKPAMRTIVGSIPIWNELADDDRYMVSMTASTEMLVREGQTKTISKGGAIRRPVGTPNIQVLAVSGSQSSCIFDCEGGDVLSPRPECRGPLGVPPEGGSTTINVRVANLGPGAIYKLKYERTTSYRQDVYPGRQPEVLLVDAMDGQEVFMPGQKVGRELERKCYDPIRMYNTQTIETVATGMETATTTSTTVSVASSFRALSSEKFDISVSRFEPEEILIDTFVTKYDPYNPETYTPNSSTSEMEPRRLGTELPTFEVASPQETITETTTTMVVRPRPEVTACCAGDGDGDGGN